jgi:uncharacterized protein YecT (DUF1311 family)
MHRMASPIAAIMLAIAPLPVLAGASEDRIDCSNAMSTVEMNFCAGQDLDAADAELNRVYKKALGAIPGMATDDPQFNAKAWEEALRKSQRAWVAFRDAECDGHVPMGWTGGTGTTVAVLGCKTDLTKARTKALKEAYESQ